MPYEQFRGPLRRCVRGPPTSPRADRAARIPRFFRHLHPLAQPYIPGAKGRRPSGGVQSRPEHSARSTPHPRRGFWEGTAFHDTTCPADQGWNPCASGEAGRRAHHRRPCALFILGTLHPHPIHTVLFPDRHVKTDIKPTHQGRHGARFFHRRVSGGDLVRPKRVRRPTRAPHQLFRRQRALWRDAALVACSATYGALRRAGSQSLRGFWAILKFQKVQQRL